MLGRVRNALRLARVCSLRRDVVAIWKVRAGGLAQGDTVLLHPRVLHGPAVEIRGGTTDLATFRSTFIEQYHRPHEDDDFSPIGALDLGANVGFTALELAARFEQATVIAVEMDPDNFAQALFNTRPFRQRVQCINAAAWIHDHGVSYALDADCDAYSVSEDSCDVLCANAASRTLDQLIDLCPNGHADFVKVDVEGAESVLLSCENSA